DAIKFALLHEVTFADQPLPGGAPHRFRLEQSYPNPCNAQAIIAYELDREGRVELRVYNAAGQQVAVLVEGTLPAGRHEVHWAVNDLPSGVYFYRLKTERQALTGKLAVVR
ncbi:MAG: T9SS type A sorting domain-containing protein, partial [Calditrichaeota bacterium]|nr:T9SS type A sorting domain-containing protein [Calditrichota bacterium]